MAENNQAFGWDDEVEESSYELLPDGDYSFRVSQWEKSYWEPKSADSKVGACQQANIELEITWTNKNGQTKTNKIIHRLKLWRSLDWMIYQFFESIGLRKKGDGSKRVPWDQIVGKTGVCQIGHHTDSKGNDYNDVVKCYAPESAPMVTKNNPTPAAPKFSL